MFTEPSQNKFIREALPNGCASRFCQVGKCGCYKVGHQTS